MKLLRNYALTQFQNHNFLLEKRLVFVEGDSGKDDLDSVESKGWLNENKAMEMLKISKDELHKLAIGGDISIKAADDGSNIYDAEDVNKIALEKDTKTKSYLTVEEAFTTFGITEDELKEKISNAEIRAFRDEDQLKFKTKDLENLATELGKSPDEKKISEAIEEPMEETHEDVVEKVGDETGIESHKGGELILKSEDEINAMEKADLIAYINSVQKGVKTKDIKTHLSKLKRKKTEKLKATALLLTERQNKLRTPEEAKTEESETPVFDTSVSEEAFDDFALVTIEEVREDVGRVTKSKLGSFLDKAKGLLKRKPKAEESDIDMSGIDPEKISEIAAGPEKVLEPSLWEKAKEKFKKKPKVKEVVADSPAAEEEVVFGGKDEAPRATDDVKWLDETREDIKEGYAITKDERRQLTEKYKDALDWADVEQIKKHLAELRSETPSPTDTDAAEVVVAETPTAVERLVFDEEVDTSSTPTPATSTVPEEKKGFWERRREAKAAKKEQLSQLNREKVSMRGWIRLHQADLKRIGRIVQGHLDQLEEDHKDDDAMLNSINTLNNLSDNIIKRLLDKDAGILDNPDNLNEFKDLRTNFESVVNAINAFEAPEDIGVIAEEAPEDTEDIIFDDAAEDEEMIVTPETGESDADTATRPRRRIKKVFRPVERARMQNWLMNNVNDLLDIYNNREAILNKYPDDHIMKRFMTIIEQSLYQTETEEGQTLVIIKEDDELKQLVRDEALRMKFLRDHFNKLKKAQKKALKATPETAEEKSKEKLFDDYQTALHTKLKDGSTVEDAKRELDQDLLDAMEGASTHDRDWINQRLGEASHKAANLTKDLEMISKTSSGAALGTLKAVTYGVNSILQIPKVAIWQTFATPINVGKSVLKGGWNVVKAAEASLSLLPGMAETPEDYAADMKRMNDSIMNVIPAFGEGVKDVQKSWATSAWKIRHDIRDNFKTAFPGGFGGRPWFDKTWEDIKLSEDFVKLTPVEKEVHRKVQRSIRDQVWTFREYAKRPKGKEAPDLLKPEKIFNRFGKSLSSADKEAYTKWHDKLMKDVIRRYGSKEDKEKPAGEQQPPAESPSSSNESTETPQTSSETRQTTNQAEGTGREGGGEGSESEATATASAAS